MLHFRNGKHHPVSATASISQTRDLQIATAIFALSVIKFNASITMNDNFSEPRVQVTKTSLQDEPVIIIHSLVCKNV